MNNESSDKKKAIGKFATNYMMLLVTFVVMLVFGGVNQTFWNMGNILNIVSNACLFGIVGIGLTLITAAGETDFCAAAEFTLAATLACTLISQLGMKNYFLVMLIVMITMVLVGLLNAVLHVYCRIPSFIATLGTSYMVNGIAKWMTNGLNFMGISRVIGPIYTYIGQGYFLGVIPMPAVVLVVMAAIMLYYTEHTRGGKYIYAGGSNPTACKFLGIDANRQKIKAFILCSVCCGIAGLIQSSMLNGSAQEMGANMLNYGMTVLMIGACFLRLGVFNVPGTIVGSLFIAIIANGMTIMGTSVASKEIVLGSVMLLATTAVTVFKLKNARGN